MSTPPPPFPPGPPQPGQPPGPQPGQPGGFQQPGYQQPGQPVYQQPGYQQAPSWQTQPGFLAQPEPPKKRSKVPLVIVAVVVLVAAGVAAFLVLGGDDDEKSAAVDAAGAHDGLATVLEDASFDETGYDGFNDCPLGDLDVLNAIVTGVLDIDESVFDGQEDMSAYDEADGFPAYVSCQVFADDESAVRDGATGVFYQGILDPPRDYEGYITDAYGDTTDLTFEDSEEYLGGEIVVYCGDGGDEGFTGCDADWFSEDDEIALAVFLGGKDIDTDDAVVALKAVLETMADTLAGQAATES